ncbi:hypothetical protein BCR44DRAFT_35869 [Catenaria anguillulae PL171]|uniref:Uncharacterized protein n=1 Tax=Catenaria anguillulae PL171 TaxID=765915 RepID=A0A1Y2H7U0_9FUNG|nr:hypothetical protein BCR44DRAFT_35869 [Catenaria anguillulae PL171]
MKPTLLIVLILALFAGNANTQGDGVAKWPTDFEFVLRSGAMSSPRCMARDNGSLRWNQAGVHMWNCNAWAEDQSAAFVNFGSYGYDMMYRIGYRSDVAPLCLDVPGGNFAEGVRIRLWECNYTIAQRFELVLHHYAKREGLARYLLRSMTQPEYCLGVTRM